MERRTFQLPKWQYDELQQIGIDFGSDQEVETYDSYMNNIRSIEQEIRQALESINLQSDHTLLEIGTGTAELAIAAARQCNKVIAIDISSSMLDYAKRKAKRLGVHNIEFYLGGFLSFAGAGRSLDAVVTQNALHHLPDTWKMIALTRIYDMLKTGGKFYLKDVIYSFDIQNYNVFFSNLVDAHKYFHGDKAEEIALSFIKEEYPTLDWIMDGMLRRAGFAIESVEHFEGFTSTFVCVKK
ncbi:class I SAM-dependent methyltransferase [Paenibacillus sp. FSL M7-0420]|uniref:class I SAM-dependent methyltransferase n=1 Tax=Paenibacillus sp. FSL M7-0420 TaxID=2921609 RepID=UPI0030F89A9E